MTFQFEMRNLNDMPVAPLFSFRFSTDTRDLVSSVQKWGIINPIHIYKSNSAEFVLDGWQRLEFLRQNKSSHPVGVMVHDGHQLSESDAFLVFIELNVAQAEFNLIEKAMIAKKAQDLFLGKSWPKILVSALEIPFQPNVLKDYRSLLKLPHFIQKYLVNNNLPLHVAVKFLNFNLEDVERLAHQLFVYPLNQNKLSEVLDLLQDLSRKESRPANQIFAEILAQISGSGLSHQKEKIIREALKKRRNPRFEAQLESFLQKTQTMPLNTQTSVVPAPYFEDDYVEVKSRIYNQNDIQNLIQVLTHKAWGDIFEN